MTRHMTLDDQLNSTLQFTYLIFNVNSGRAFTRHIYSSIESSLIFLFHGKVFQKMLLFVDYIIIQVQDQVDKEDNSAALLQRHIHTFMFIENNISLILYLFQLTGSCTFKKGSALVLVCLYYMCFIVAYSLYVIWSHLIPQEILTRKILSLIQENFLC